MVEYVPPPKDLSRLNPIQRYMQKGSLDWSDWLRLFAVVLAYWFLRPYLQKVTKKWSEETQTGEGETAAYERRRAEAAVGANEIRSGRQKEESKTLGQVLEQGVEGFAAASGAKSTPRTNENGAEVKNRKSKKKGVSFAPEKSELEKTLDWEDESEFEPKRQPVSSVGGAAGGDVKDWMEKWTS